MNNMKHAFGTVTFEGWLKLLCMVVAVLVYVINSHSAIDQVMEIAKENKANIAKINEAVWLGMKNQEVLAQRFTDHMEQTKGMK